MIQAQGNKNSAIYSVSATIQGYINSVPGDIEYTYALGQAVTLTTKALSNFTLYTDNRKVYTETNSSTAAPTAFLFDVYIEGFEVPL